MTSTAFTAAQERILARRIQRAHEQRFINRQLSQGSSGPATYLLDHVNTFVKTITSPFGTNPAFRVGQVDAELLDEELINLLQTQTSQALKYFRSNSGGNAIFDDWTTEIDLGLRTVLWKLSIWDKGVSYGGLLQGLRFVDARNENKKGLAGYKAPSSFQKIAYGIVTVVGRYGWEKWEDWLVDRESDIDADETSTTLGIPIQKLSQITRKISAVYELLAFVSFLAFLYNGRYRTLFSRLLGLRLVPTNAGSTSRDVSFEYLNRQLVWHAFTEFLLFILPLVGISRWRRWLSRAWSRARNYMAAGQENEEHDLKGELAFLPERTCGICYREQNPSTGASEAEVMASSIGGGGVVGSAQTDVTNPYEAIPCGCVYCFVCLAKAIEAEDGYGWTCLRCGQNIKECQPWFGDVLHVDGDALKVNCNAEDTIVTDTHRLSTMEPRPLEYDRRDTEEDWQSPGRIEHSDAESSARTNRGDDYNDDYDNDDNDDDENNDDDGDNDDDDDDM